MGLFFFFPNLIAQSSICAAVQLLLMLRFPSTHDSCTTKLSCIAFGKSRPTACGVAEHFIGNCLGKERGTKTSCSCHHKKKREGTLSVQILK